MVSMKSCTLILFSRAALFVVLFLSSGIVAAVPISAQTINYTYDKKGQLLRADYGEGSVIDYSYDPAGNRLTAESCAADPTQPAPPAPPRTLSAGYSLLLPSGILKARNVFFPEQVILDLPKSVALKGGYLCDFLNQKGLTLINGSLEIRNGQVTLEYVAIQ